MAYLILLDRHPSSTRFEVGKFLLNVKNLTPFLKRVRFFFIPKYKLFSPANGQFISRNNITDKLNNRST